MLKIFEKLLDLIDRYLDPQPAPEPETVAAEIDFEEFFTENLYSK